MCYPWFYCDGKKVFLCQCSLPINKSLKFSVMKGKSQKQEGEGEIDLRKKGTFGLP
jgi:hypothetical protein